MSAVALAGCSLALMVASAPTWGATGHVFLSQLTGAPLSDASALATDKAGKLFVTNPGAGAVEVFAGGKFETNLGVGVLGNDLPSVAVDSGGRVYVVDREANTLDVFKPEGATYVLLSEWTGANATGGATFGEIAAVAVDNSNGGTGGEVYVVDQAESVVDVFKAQPESSSEADLLATLAGGKPKFEEPNAVAVSGTTGEVYVATETSTGFAVEKFSSAGVFESKLTGKETPLNEFGSIAALAVEEGSEDLYVTDGENKVVDQFNAAGASIGTVTLPEGKSFGEPLGVALAGSELFVVDAASPLAAGAAAVDTFGPNVIVPDASTDKATKIERTSVTLNGTLNPREVEAKSPATYFFEYGETGEYGSRTPEVSGQTGESPAKVSALVANLKPGTEYYFRLVAKNANGFSYGVNQEFETPPAVSGLSTGAAEAVEPTSAVVTGTLNGPLGNAKTANPSAKYLFEYGTTTALGSKSAEVAVGEVAGAVAAEAKLSALQPNTVYHYRIAASDTLGTSFGEERTFKTAGPPTITSAPTTAITHVQATVNAQIDPGERATEYFVEYGESTAYGKSTGKTALAAGEKPVPVAVSLAELGLATTYHFRFVAQNSVGTVAGPDQEFTTVLIESVSVKELTGESAVLQAQINPEGVETTYRFEFGETASYGTRIPATAAEEEEKALAGTEDTIVEAPLSGLRPGTTYHFRVVATLAGVGSAASADRTFTTPTGELSPTLPDDRSYEMVSPPDKKGGYIEPINRVGGAIQASESGDALGFVVDGPIVENPEGNRSPLAQQALSTRGPDEWHSQEIVAPHERAYGASAGIPPEYQLFSADLSLSVMQPYPFGLTPYAEPPLTPPLTASEREVIKEDREPDRLNQEKSIYLRADQPVPPGPGEETAYNEAVHNGEVLAGEHGESVARPGYLALVSAANVLPGAKFGGTVLESTHKGFPATRVSADLYFRGATPDLSHVVLASRTTALAPSGPSAPGLYEWGANELQLVSVLPGPGQVPGPSESRLGFESGTAGTNSRNAISRDGSRVFWSVNEGGENHQSGLGSLYMRDTSKGETVRIDLPESGVPPSEPARAEFQIASADGSKVFFTDTRRLTADSSARSESAAEHVPSAPDLYECEIQEAAATGKLEPCKLRDLTAEHAGESGSVQGLVQGASEDGSTIYFVADGALVPGAAPGNCGAVAFPPPGAMCNLYEMHEAGGTWTTHLIGRLSREDAPDWFNTRQNARLLVDMTARVSPNGRFLAFMSNQRLTGYDNTDINEIEGQPGEGKRHADEEVFLYDSAAEDASNALVCVSCNPTGARPKGVYDTELAGEGAGLVVDRPQVWVSPGGQGGAQYNQGIAHWLAGNIPGWTSRTQLAAIYQSRYLSDDGRLFFNSADPLTSQASQLTRKETVGGAQTSVGVENVYQYEPKGLGTCTKTPGCTTLLSSGSSAKESAFLDASASGNDVFFLTAAQVLPQDQDTAFDIYDARVCSPSSPCQAQHTPTSPPCAGAPECRPGSSSAPGFEAPPTASFSGPGNVLHAVPTGKVLPDKATKLTRAQKLTRALKACRKLPHRSHAQKHKRARCEATARRLYGAKRAGHAKKSPQRGAR